MPFLEVKNISKVYSTKYGGSKVTALSNVSFSMEKGEFIAIMGESGSGKTTLLNIIAALVPATSGEVILDGRKISSIKEKERARFRRTELGFVFQEYNLLDTFTVRDNILLPLVLSGMSYAKMNDILLPMANLMGIGDILEKYPYEISGGQKQKTACCRAIITSPKLLLADEPTGALDSKSSDELLQMFVDLNSKDSRSICMVTHSVKAASFASRVLFIKDGEVYHQIYKGSQTNREFYNKITDSLQIIIGGEK